MLYHFIFKEKLSHNLFISAYNSAVIQKHNAAVNESGVITYLSFLLLDKKFIIVFKERYTAITMPIIPVTFSENHNGIKPPSCKITIKKNSCRISCVAKTSLNFLGKTLYRPPSVSSPNGKPHIIKTDNIITTEKAIAPIIAAIFLSISA